VRLDLQATDGAAFFASKVRYSGNGDITTCTYIPNERLRLRKARVHRDGANLLGRLYEASPNLVDRVLILGAAQLVQDLHVPPHRAVKLMFSYIQDVLVGEPNLYCTHLFNALEIRYFSGTNVSALIVAAVFQQLQLPFGYITLMPILPVPVCAFPRLAGEWGGAATKTVLRPSMRRVYYVGTMYDRIHADVTVWTCLMERHLWIRPIMLSLCSNTRLLAQVPQAQSLTHKDFIQHATRLIVDVQLLTALHGI
jgi:hypothetical protein